VLPGYFASSGFHGAFIEVPYVERSLVGLKNVFHFVVQGIDVSSAALALIL